ncbi:oxidoreductase [Psychrobacter jeotgali]|uniref:oxidoreductase n=1 Tax=Psychrobacter jeotgali TaxID=179010 RepID=UPI001919CC48|nr:oxidoreductase [Psychrobacter jeotgali]
MKDLLKNKTILIAGAGGLLGSRLVVGILSQGGNVIAADINVEETKKLLSELDANIAQSCLQVVPLDITNKNSIKEIFLKNPNIDGAVNATYPRNKSYGAHFFDVTPESFNENISLHLGSSFLFTQQCAAYFKTNKKEFSLVNISSIYGVVAPDFSIYENTSMTMSVEYAAIKSGLLHLNKYVVNYINDSKFRINAVSPGGLFDSQPKPFLEAYKKKTHGNGMLDSQDILGAILFLLSNQSRYVTGQNIIVDDGFSL